MTDENSLLPPCGKAFVLFLELWKVSLKFGKVRCIEFKLENEGCAKLCN